ncbi:MAG: methionine adenosyltransferase, partial [Calditrichia bacterium]|nr:methionine adenosyltransferase [Calditrichia bacterium]
SVTEGHPDKVADQISDAVLDAILEEDPNGRVACETYVTTGLALIGGEITTTCYVDLPKVVRELIHEIGYNDPDIGFDWESIAVLTSINRQSPDIALGVDRDGAGDQGMMFGYACDETPELMPMPIQLAHQVVRKLTDVRKNNVLDFLRPDGKSMVTVRYENNKPVSVEKVLVAAQHTPNVKYDVLKEAIIEEVIKKSIDPALLSDKVEFLVNPTGRFVIGGPTSDTGLTGRKIIVDTYGGAYYHGGGAFSGKDATKVDRSAAYYSRYVTKNIVAAGLAKKCGIQVSYAIGVAEPVSIMIDSFGTGKMPDEELAKKIAKIFDFTPKGMISELDLRRPVFEATAAYGHFGRSGEGFTWERADRIKDLQNL